MMNTLLIPNDFFFDTQQVLGSWWETKQVLTEVRWINLTYT
jgi:hypothetical protein